ncbi:ComEA family DNA-binding protein [Gallaecimonas mangrovi]|uniref:ComEA family DNA-binding protein n=1 Tax=Gallaecimonas mangrovi TaxID=2291597 RepID=UPI000E1FDCBC|nr:ComEA family DNA-binding protein [Gallaecimonas mangrovi]
MKRTFLQALLFVASALVCNGVLATANVDKAATEQGVVKDVAKAININSASAEDIAHNLKGVGAKKAALIIEYREAHGPFKNLEDLKKVKGIGDKLLSANADKIRFK